MNYNYFLLAVIALCLTASVIKISELNTETAKAESLAVIDRFLSQVKGNIHTGDDLLLPEDAEFASTSQKTFGDKTQAGSEGGGISTMFDRYGNKTETRTFNFHTRLTRIMLISSPDGQRRVFVYGQNGDVKDLPENMLDKVMSASPDEIADAAGIVITQQRTAPTYAQATKLENLPPMRITPENQSQIQSQSTESGRIKENREAKTTAEINEKNALSAAEGNYPEDDAETSTKRQPEEK